ncbi:MAG: DUF2059 domain-containing protein [Rhodobacteraceae bacterium]|nr:DUF2059 domain-containing protein [Paracoccaceae bacterium]
MFHRIATVVLAGALLVVPHPMLAADPATAKIDALAQSLHLDETFDVMSAEGLNYGKEIDSGLLGGRGGAAWDRTIRQIYDPVTMLDRFKQELASNLADSDADLDAIAAFFDSELGQRVTVLEISARRAMLDPAVDDASRAQLAQMQAEEAPRLRQIEAFVRANDLVESNVAGALTANFAFVSGLVEAKGGAAALDEADILAEVWTHEAEIRDQMETWVHSYLAMAYGPLSDDDLAAYQAFSESGPGQALNRAMFAGFDRVLTDVSRKLGFGAGRILAGQDL